MFLAQSFASCFEARLLFNKCFTIKSRFLILCKFGADSQSPTNKLSLEIQQIMISVHNVLQSLVNKESEIKELQEKVNKLEQKSKSETHSCEDCRKYFKSNSTLTIHIKKYHNKPEFEFMISDDKIQLQLSLSPTSDRNEEFF